MMYVVGSVNENEVLLYNVILALRDSLVRQAYRTPLCQ